MRSLGFLRVVGLDDARQEAFDGIEKFSLRHDWVPFSREKIKSRGRSKTLDVTKFLVFKSRKAFFGMWLWWGGRGLLMYIFW